MQSGTRSRRRGYHGQLAPPHDVVGYVHKSGLVGSAAASSCSSATSKARVSSSARSSCSVVSFMALIRLLASFLLAGLAHDATPTRAKIGATLHVMEFRLRRHACI